MYRDDHEALQARINTLETAARADRRAREAAEAGCTAARTRLDEVQLTLKRLGEEPDPPMWRRHGLTLVALVVALVAATAFVWQRWTHVIRLSQANQQLRERATAAEGRADRERVDATHRLAAVSRTNHLLAQENERLRQRLLEHRDQHISPVTLRPTGGIYARAGKGYLLVSSKPFARIHIDGRDINRQTPTPPSMPVVLDPGLHRVTLDTGNRHFTFPVTITAGETARLIKRLPTDR